MIKVIYNRIIIPIKIRGRNLIIDQINIKVIKIKHKNHKANMYENKFLIFKKTLNTKEKINRNQKINTKHKFYMKKSIGLMNIMKIQKNIKYKNTMMN